MTNAPRDRDSPTDRGPGAPGARPARAATLPLPLALAGLGVRQLLTRSPIPAWQPAAPGSAHPAAAALDGTALLAFALLATTGPRRDLGFLGLAALLLGWIAVLQAPGLAAAPSAVTLWLGAAEVGALVAAAALVGVSLRPAGPRVRAWRAAGFAAYGSCCLVFGASHFAYAAFTAKMIPAWIPARTELAYLTGAAHVAAGLAIGSGILRRTAAVALACMMASFVALVHVPAVLATRGSLVEVTFLLNACALCGSAVAVAAVSTMATHPGPRSGHA